eukprot:gb/GEZN01000179.1/.p2 GENE.gb/GEZN01000179.1/~~gb/GEZN01000179.1/.p2  ORF type:complete len:951 (-),score=221.99 gb/GEZN01000179.1/:173-3025(-)
MPASSTADKSKQEANTDESKKKKVDTPPRKSNRYPTAATPSPTQLSKSCWIRLPSPQHAKPRPRVPLSSSDLIHNAPEPDNENNNNTDDKNNNNNTPPNEQFKQDLVTQESGFGYALGLVGKLFRTTTRSCSPKKETEQAELFGIQKPSFATRLNFVQDAGGTRGLWRQQQQPAGVDTYSQQQPQQPQQQQLLQAGWASENQCRLHAHLAGAAGGGAILYLTQQQQQQLTWQTQQQLIHPTQTLIQQQQLCLQQPSHPLQSLAGGVAVVLEKLLNGDWRKPLQGGVYTGDIQHGLAHGKGVLVWPNGEKYVGEFNMDLFQGEGTYGWPDGSQYKGAWRAGKREGFGVGTYASGAKYQGDFSKGKFHGQGTFIYSNGAKYVGSWENGESWGYGTLSWLSGDIYEGQFKHGKGNGRGRFCFANGTEYQGEIKKGKGDGNGTFTYRNGAKYVGLWKQGKKSGRGSWLGPGGVQFHGLWKKGKRQGTGSYTFPDGTTRAGAFKNDMPKGPHTTSTPNGLTFTQDYGKGEVKRVDLSQESEEAEYAANCLFLGSIDPEMTEMELVDFVAKFGAVKEFQLVRDTSSSLCMLSGSGTAVLNGTHENNEQQTQQQKQRGLNEVSADESISHEPDTYVLFSYLDDGLNRTAEAIQGLNGVRLGDLEVICLLAKGAAAEIRRRLAAKAAEEKQAEKGPLSLQEQDQESTEQEPDVVVERIRPAGVGHQTPQKGGSPRRGIAPVLITAPELAPADMDGSTTTQLQPHSPFRGSRCNSLAQSPYHGGTRRESRGSITPGRIGSQGRVESPGEAPLTTEAAMPETPELKLDLGFGFSSVTGKKHAQARTLSLRRSEGNLSQASSPSHTSNLSQALQTSTSYARGSTARCQSSRAASHLPASASWSKAAFLLPLSFSADRLSGLSSPSLAPLSFSRPASTVKEKQEKEKNKDSTELEVAKLRHS